MLLTVICLPFTRTQLAFKAKVSFVLLDHYCKVAESYDDYYLELDQAQIESVVESLDLQPDHVMADIGGGTGRFAEEIFQLAGLKKKILCVEPSAEMLEKAKGRKGVEPVLKTGEEFFSDVSLRGTIDRVLFKYSFHHLSDPLSVFKDIERSLRPNGLCLIVSIRSISCYKRFAEVTGLAGEYHPLDENQGICQMFKEANFNVETSVIELPLILRKAKFYSMLRGHFMSSLYSISDQQIEKGIEVLEQGEFSRIEENEQISSTLTHVLIKARKS